ncbi:MAG: glyoxalase superfamily protein [bacterium]
MIENLTPILRVENLEASRRYYIQTLGFSLDWDAGAMISVSRDGQSIMLCKGAQGRPGVWLWIGVADADAFFSEFSAKGAYIRSSPQNFSWA